MGMGMHNSGKTLTKKKMMMMMVSHSTVQGATPHTAPAGKDAAHKAINHREKVKKKQ
jgi:hypothetical protein